MISWKINKEGDSPSLRCFRCLKVEIFVEMQIYRAWYGAAMMIIIIIIIIIIITLLISSKKAFQLNLQFQISKT